VLQNIISVICFSVTVVMLVVGLTPRTHSLVSVPDYFLVCLIAPLQLTRRCKHQPLLGMWKQCLIFVHSCQYWGKSPSPTSCNKEIKPLEALLTTLSYCTRYRRLTATQVRLGKK